MALAPLRRAAALLPLMLLLGSGMSSAQAPGYQQLNPQSVRAEYTAEVLERINDVYADWGEAWSTDKVDDLVELYWEDAVLIPPGRSPLRGREQMRTYFVEVLATHGHAEAFMLDFDASGGMAQVFGNYAIGIQQGPLAGKQLTGPLVTVYVRRGRTWRIRSQVFVEG